MMVFCWVFLCACAESAFVRSGAAGPSTASILVCVVPNADVVVLHVFHGSIVGVCGTPAGFGETIARVGILLRCLVSMFCRSSSTCFIGIIILIATGWLSFVRSSVLSVLSGIYMWCQDYLDVLSIFWSEL